MKSFCLDVVQDAVLRVIRNVKPVESDRQFFRWLQLVVQTTAFDLLRGEKRRKKIVRRCRGLCRCRWIPIRCKLDWLNEQISSLDPELVKIIELRFEQRWTLRRIGELLGVSSGAIDGRLRRALLNLRHRSEDESPVTNACKNRF